MWILFTARLGPCFTAWAQTLALVVIPPHGASGPCHQRTPGARGMWQQHSSIPSIAAVLKTWTAFPAAATLNITRSYLSCMTSLSVCSRVWQIIWKRRAIQIWPATTNYLNKQNKKAIGANTQVEAKFDSCKMSLSGKHSFPRHNQQHCVEVLFSPMGCINNLPQHLSTRCQMLVVAQYDVIQLYAGSMSKQIFTLLGTTVTTEMRNLGPNRGCCPKSIWGKNRSSQSQS